MSNQTFNIKDADGSVRPVKLVDKLTCGFADGRIVLMGETEENTFAIEIKNPKDSNRCPVQGVHLTEGSLMAFYATMCVYFQHKGINPHELYKKYLPGGQDSVPCNFKVFDENDTEE